MPKKRVPENPPGAARRRRAEQAAPCESRVKAEAAPRAVARSASLEAVLTSCDQLDSQHSRFVVKADSTPTRGHTEPALTVPPKPHVGVERIERALDARVLEQLQV